MDIQTLFLNVLVGCIALAVLIAIGKLLFRITKVLFGLSKATGNLFRSNEGPNPNAVGSFKGQIVDARNWHAAGGGFYSEFWLKDHHGLERRYKLSGTHPELRKGHRVTLYEYAGTLVTIQNQSTGQELWLAPDWLLASLYPTGRRRQLILWCLGLTTAYVFLKLHNPGFQDLYLFLALMIFAGRVLTLLLAHLFSSASRRAERLSVFSAFCVDATKSL